MCGDHEPIRTSSSSCRGESDSAYSDESAGLLAAALLPRCCHLEAGVAVDRTGSRLLDGAPPLTPPAPWLQLKAASPRDGGGRGLLLTDGGTVRTVRTGRRRPPHPTQFSLCLTRPSSHYVSLDPVLTTSHLTKFSLCLT